MTADPIAYATAQQQAAADPTTSVWVSANAGTGKTRVLTERILRLMIEQHAPPHSIHALTYTRTAAKEMQRRLNDILARWYREAATCQTDLHHLLGRSPTDEEHTRARGLWEAVIQRPPTIQTFHSFAQDILTLQEDYNPETAPTLLETSTADALRTQAFDVAVQQITAPEHPHFAAGQFLLGQLGEQHLRDVTTTALNNPDLWQNDLDKLAAALHVDPALTPADLTRFLTQEALPSFALRDELAALAQTAVADKGKKYSALIINMQRWLQNTPKDWERYKAFFLKQDGDKYNANSFLDKQAREAHPWLLDEIDRVAAAEETRRSMQTFLENKLLQPFLDIAIQAYTHLKTNRNTCDYADLIQQATALLINPETRDGIHYQLDQKIQHILLDEGQDTNDKQLLLFQLLADEFFAGEGASGTRRTAFAVGDVKQSIFRFQGAAPATFGQIRTRLAQKQHTQAPFTEVTLQTSFRSAPAILQAVDDIFSAAPQAERLTGGLGDVKHQAAHTARRGQVTLWPPIASPAKDETDPWALPTFTGVTDSAARQLADHVAQTIQTLLADTTPLACTGQPVQPQDILILCRGRQSALWPALQQRLHARGIPLQTDQAEKALDHPIVQDMLAFLTTLLQPTDDIALLHTLRSPLCRWDMQQLHTLLQQKEKNQPLWHNLPTQAPHIYTRLCEWQAALSQATPVHPAQLLHEIYKEINLKARFWQAYGQPGQTGTSTWHHIENILDAFLEAAATRYDPTHDTPWPHLLETLRTEGFDLPTTDTKSQAVRLMTVHQAKGQEAPVVFLPETTKNMAEIHRNTHVLTGADFHLWRTDKSNRSTLQARLEKAEIDANITDEMRLLYVALTRAEEQLYIGGTADKKGNIPSQCWYQLIQQAATTHNWPTVDRNTLLQLDAVTQPATLAK